MTAIRYRGGNRWPEYYGPAAYWDYEIQLDGDYSTIQTNFDTIRGIVHFTPTREIDFQDLRIRLEGHSRSKFGSNLDKWQTNTNEHRFLPDETTKESSTATLISFYFIHNWKPKKPEFKFKGRNQLHSFPFELQLRGQILPASFENEIGQINYKLVLYVYHTCSVAEKILQTKGCLNLNEINCRPLSLNWTRDSSSLFSFNKRPLLKVNLIVNSRGYVPTDNLIFQLTVINSNVEMSVSKLCANFVQKMIYFANNSTKIQSTILSHKEIFCHGGSDVTVSWEEVIDLPSNLMPTYEGKRRPVSILYFLQILVESGAKLILKEEAPILIGSARDGRRSLGGASSCNSQSRRSSIESNFDSLSIQSYSTLPPSYSGLSSRRGSSGTLPPTYEEASANGVRLNQLNTGDEAEYWQRRKSNLI